MTIKEVCPAMLYRLENKKKRGAKNKSYNLIFVEDETGDIVPLLFSDSDVSGAFINALKNKEDVPEYRLKNNKECVNIYITGILCVLGFVSGAVSYWTVLQTFN